MFAFAITVSIAAALVAILMMWRHTDRQLGRETTGQLLALAKTARRKARLYETEELPEPAQRYFRFTMSDGAPIRMVAEIEMTGEMDLGTKADPKYQPMRASETLAPPFGFVWQMSAGAIGGSDGAMPGRSWTRFWLFGLIPIARASGKDHLKSAFGRTIAEGAFWVPAHLLDRNFVTWQALDKDSARAIVAFEDFRQAVDITVDDEGKPTQVLIQRWSNVNPQKEFKEQPFGGALSDFRDVEGYRLPFRVEGGNHFGTEDYFPFFKAEVTAITFPEGPARK